ncbi:MAG: hypothetical protein ACI4SJ_03135, partial [Candidatus Avispirillum sp.]
MKKRILSALLLCVLLLSSCGLRPVGSGDKPADSTAPPQSEPVTSDTAADTDPPEVIPETKVSFAGCGDNIIYYGTYRDAAAQA